MYEEHGTRNRELADGDDGDDSAPGSDTVASTPPRLTVVK
jgi:hypothetical protein